jgi:hypothetical protein
VPQDTPFDPYEIGARNSDPELGALQPFPPAPKRLPPMELLGLFAVGVVVVAIIRGGVGGSGPEVKGSCTAPAFALSKDSVAQFEVVKWSVAGPSGSTVLLGVDVDTAVGASGDALLGRRTLSGCKASGQFGLRVGPGDHTVSAFLLRPDGTSSTIATDKLTVTSP